MHTKVQTSIGKSVLLVVLLSLAIMVVSLAWVSILSVRELGEYAVDANEANIESQAKLFLSRLAGERAKRYQDFFENQVARVRHTAGSAAYFLDHKDVYSAGNLGRADTFRYSPAKQMFGNAPEADVSSVYWDSPKMTPDVVASLNAVAHVDRQLLESYAQTPGVAAAWLMLDNTIVRYVPNTHLVGLMPPVSEFDYRDDHCFSLGKPETNPMGIIRWSDVYQDTVGQGLVVTVASPIYGEDGFLGVTGLDFSVDTLVSLLLADDGFSRGPKPTSEFGFLVARDGGIVAFPTEHLQEFGVDVGDPASFSPGQLLQTRLSDSAIPAVVGLAQDMQTNGAGLSRITLGGETRLVAYRTLAATGWCFGVVVEEGDFMASINQTRAAIDLGVGRIIGIIPPVAVGTLLLTMMLLALFVMKKLVRPLNKFVGATMAISRGEFEHVVDIDPEDDFGDLAQYFNAMARDLEAMRDDLEKAEEKYRSIFETAVEGFYQSKADGTLLSVNPSLAKMMGYASPAELLASTPNVRETYVDPKDRRVLLRDIMAGKDVMEFETQVYTKDKSILWVVLSGRGVFDEDGTFLYVNGIMVNATERKQAENRIRELSQELMLAQENERRRISRDLHDNVAQILSTLRIRCGLLFDGFPEVPGPVRRRVEDLDQGLGASIASVRELAYGLRPSILDELGLTRTLEQYGRDFTSRTGLRVDFSSAGLETHALDPILEINFYRLAQEALHNIEKHARANNVSMKLVASHPNILLRIEDDGCGFEDRDLEAVKGERRLGLKSMEERVLLLGGTLSVRSSKGKGTHLVAEVPLRNRG